MQILQQWEEIFAEGHRYPRPRLPKDATSSVIAVAAVRRPNDSDLWASLQKARAVVG